MSSDLAGLLLAFGRVLLGGLYVYAGARHFFMIEPIAAYMTQRGVPFARAVLIVGSLSQVVGGGAVALGLFVGPAALYLAVFTLVASVMMLNYWDLQGEARANAIANWRLNVAILGGLLATSATGF